LLALQNRTYVHESLAIIEYLEDLAESRGLATMRGRTTAERARVRDMLGLAEEMTHALELAAVHGCIIFVPEIENQQSAASVRYALTHCHKKLAKIEE
jgi:glutathione S-transferase